MDQVERKAKEKELYDLMELDVMRNSEEMRGFLANLYSQMNNGEDGKDLIDKVYPKVMTHQDLTDEMLQEIAGGQEGMIEKLKGTIEFIKKYQKGELMNEAEQENTEDNEK